MDCIAGTVAVCRANAMPGETKPAMAEAVTSCAAVKLLPPLTKENVKIVGVAEEPLPHLVQSLVEKLKEEVLTDV
jgi:hypothetical protein